MAEDDAADPPTVRRNPEEGARRFQVSGGGSAVSLSTHAPIDISRETNGDVLLLFTLRVFGAPESAGIAMRDAAGKMVVSPVMLPQGGEFVRYGIPLKCLRDKGLDMSKLAAPFILATEGAADFAISEVTLGTDAQVMMPCA